MGVSAERVYIVPCSVYLFIYMTKDLGSPCIFTIGGSPFRSGLSREDIVLAYPGWWGIDPVRVHSLTLLPYKYQSKHMVWQNNGSPRSFGVTPPL